MTAPRRRRALAAAGLLLAALAGAGLDAAARRAAGPRAAKPPAAGYHLTFTFACRSPEKLAEVLAALDRHDVDYALGQTDCLPVPDGRAAMLLSVAGTVARVRLCAAQSHCIDVYADAATVVGPNGQPVGK